MFNVTHEDEKKVLQNKKLITIQAKSIYKGLVDNGIPEITETNAILRKKNDPVFIAKYKDTSEEEYKLMEEISRKKIFKLMNLIIEELQKMSIQDRNQAVIDPIKFYEEKIKLKGT